MIKKVKREIMLITYGIVLFAILNNFSTVLFYARQIISLSLPVLLGFVIAFILNAPMRGFENLIDKLSFKFKKKIKPKSKNTISLILTILSILLVLFAVFTIAIPKISESVKSIILTIDEKIPEFLIWLEKKGIDTTTITDKLATFDLENIIRDLTQGALTVFTTAVGATVDVVKVVSKVVIAIIISIYLLLDKENLSRQVKKLIYKGMKSEKADSLYKTGYLVRDTFSKFLSGQCFEAVILAVLILILFWIFRLPYGSLVAILAAVFSFVPYIGSFIACLIGAILTLIVAPSKLLVYLAVYLGAQFVEQQFIYPHVVGNSVGLSPFYTIVAVLVGGNLFGVFGMIFFIPLFSVISTLIKNSINKEAPQEVKNEDK